MTAERPDRTCGVEGCTDPAVARLFDRGSDGGLRCTDCLLHDLDARQVRPDGGHYQSAVEHAPDPADGADPEPAGMPRITFRLPRELCQRLDRLVATDCYPSRSAALRAAVDDTFGDVPAAAPGLPTHHGILARIYARQARQAAKREGER